MDKFASGFVMAIVLLVAFLVFLAFIEMVTDAIRGDSEVRFMFVVVFLILLVGSIGGIIGTWVL